MDAKREEEIELLIKQRSQSHVRELWDAYIKVKVELEDLKKKYDEDIKLGENDFSNGYKGGVEDMRDAFVVFLLSASKASAKKVEGLKSMDGHDLLKLLRSTEDGKS